MARKHWSRETFVQTSTCPAYDGSDAVNRRGYCRECFGDMQSFGCEGKDGSLLHYTSHGTAKRLGLWGHKAA